MLTIDHTVRSYSGKPGCMCGCQGTYNESERARKMAIKALLNDSSVQFDSWDDEGCLSVTTATRTRVLYLNRTGVEMARSMGLEENCVYG